MERWRKVAWDGLVVFQKREINTLVGMSELIQVERMKKVKWRPKLTVIEIVKKTCLLRT